VQTAAAALSNASYAITLWTGCNKGVKF